jgi:hypothetical protein
MTARAARMAAALAAFILKDMLIVVVEKGGRMCSEDLLAVKAKG